MRDAGTGMDSQRHSRIKEVFLAAIDRPREEWRSVLDDRCAGDPELRRQVELLLDFHVDVDGNVARRATAAAADAPTAAEIAAPAAAGRGPDAPTARFREASSAVRERGALAVGQGAEGNEPAKKASRSSFHMDHGRFVPGDEISGRYRIVALIGKGGMGEVYRADDLKLGQAVALKFLPPALAATPKRLEQFMNEVRVARQVSHPNVCRVYDIGEHGDEQFISMEYVDGETLDSLMSRIGRLPERKAVQLAQELCAALAAIHDQGILHRDLKPANIMIDGRGQVRLTDFGLASARELHGFEAASGTPGFVAPESIAGKEATVQSDIYALGLVLYELFTGVPAYKPGPAKAVLKAQETEDPPPPGTQAPDLSPEVGRAIEACLARDPADRPRSVRDLAGLLPGGDPLAAALAAGVTPSPALVAASGKHGRLRKAAAGAWLALFLALLVGGWMMRGGVGLLRYAALPKSPDVLADRAESIIDRLGYATQWMDRAYQMDIYNEYIAEVETKDRSQSRWERLKRTRPSPIDFWYRRSPVLMATMNPLGWISWQDPPQDTPGMISLRLTPTGLLREMNVVSEQLYWAVKPEAARLPTVRMDEKPIQPDWGPLFEAAGLDKAKFYRVDPVRIPVVYADCRAAWLGAYPEYPDETVRVEAAGLHGKPVSFRTVEVDWPLSQNIGAIELGADHPNTRLPYEIVLGVLVAVAVGAAIVLAQRNLRFKRADRPAAVRVGTALLGVMLLAMLLSADTMTSFSPWYSPLTNALAVATALAVAFAVSYMAIEPHLRRVWPETMVAWARVLSGQVLDPLVGQSLLVGAVFGSAGIVVLGLRVYAARWLGHPPPEPVFDYDYGMEPLGETRQAIGMLAQIAGIALAFAIAFTLIQLVLRLAFKRTGVAVAIGAVVYGALWSLKFHTTPWSSPETWVLFTIGGAACGLVLVRYGVLALAAGVYVYYVLKVFPRYTPGAWYADVALAGAAVACFIAVFGAAVAAFGSTRRRMFGVAPAPSRATV